MNTRCDATEMEKLLIISQKRIFFFNDVNIYIYKLVFYFLSRVLLAAEKAAIPPRFGVFVGIAW